MKLLRVVLAFFIVCVSIFQRSMRCMRNQAGQAGDAACETSSELEVAAMLINWGKWLLIIVAVLVVLFY